MQQIIAFDIGIRNMAYCVLHTDPAASATPKVAALNVVDLCCRRNDPQKIVDATLDMLQSIVEDLDMTLPTHVFIESQMTAAMKCIQTVINTFFKMMAKYEGFNVTSRYLSPAHKLSLTRQHPEYTALTADVSAYRKNKMDSVHFTTWYLEHVARDQATLARIQSFRKKDDVCDAYLMCIYAISMASDRS